MWISRFLAVFKEQHFSKNVIVLQVLTVFTGITKAIKICLLEIEILSFKISVVTNVLRMDFNGF